MSEENKKTPSQIDYDHATLILRDASSYGLEWEVEVSAKKYIKEGFGYVESYERAYSEWVK